MGWEFSERSDDRRLVLGFLFPYFCGDLRHGRGRPVHEPLGVLLIREIHRTLS